MTKVVRVVSSEPFTDLFDYSDMYVDPILVETLYPKLIPSLVDVAVWGLDYRHYLKVCPMEVLDQVGFPLDVKYHVYNLTLEAIDEFVGRMATKYGFSEITSIEIHAGWSWVITGVAYANNRTVHNIQAA